MLHKLRNDGGADNGFTLIELIIVVIVIAIIAAIAIPVYNNFQDRAKQTTVDSTARIISQEYHATSDNPDTFFRNEALRKYSAQNPEMTFVFADRRANTSCIRVSWKDSPEISSYGGSECPSENIQMLSCSTGNGSVVIPFTVQDSSRITFQMYRANDSYMTGGAINNDRRTFEFSNESIARQTAYVIATVTTPDGQTLSPVRINCS